MKMNFYLFSTLLMILFSSNLGLAQCGEMTPKDLLAVKNSKTYFVLDEEENSSYNVALREGSKYWTYTKVDFIKYSQLEEYVKKPNTSFVMKLIFSVNTNSSSGSYAYNFNMKTHKFEKSYGVNNGPGLSYRYDGIVLVTGERKKPEFGWSDWLAYSLINDINTPETYVSKMSAYIQVIQNVVLYFDKSGDKNLNLSKAKELYNSQKKLLKEKTLYVREGDLPEKIKDLKQLKESYKFNIAIVGDEDLKSAIEKQDDKIVILHHTTTGNRYYPYLTLAKGGEVLYMDMDRNYVINPAKSVKKLLAELCE